MLPISGNAIEVAAIVYGSYRTYENADLSRSLLESRLNEPLDITQVMIQGRTYYRVHGAANSDIVRARAQLARVRTQVEPDAWLQINSFNPVKSAPIASISILPVPPQVPDSPTAETPVESVARIETAAPPGKSDFRTSPSSGIEATKTPLVLAKYSSVDIKIDGQLDEAIWNDVEGYDNMTVVDPDVMTGARYKTETKLLYTDEGL